MQYNPTVNNRSGEILGSAQVNSAQTRAAGQQALVDGIARGATSAIGGALGAFTKANTSGMITDAKGNAVPGLGKTLDDVRAQAIKYETAAGMLDSYKQNATALGLDLQMLDGIGEKYKNKPNELLGALTVVERIGNNNMELARQKAQYEGAKELARQKSTLGVGSGSSPDFSIDVLDGIDTNR
jgi:hypothetical protein